MNSKVLLVIRIIFGLMLIFFGANKLFNFMPPPEDLPENIMNYMGAMMSSKTFYLIAAVELLSGLSLVFNKYVALMMIILMSVSVNAVLFHIALAPEGIMPALVLLVLNIVVMIGYRDRYREILRA